MKEMVAFVFSLLFVVGCASTDPPNPTPVTPDSGPVTDAGPVEDSGPYPDPYADAGPGTCVGNCGSWDLDTLCACDELCTVWGDCCPDKQTVCEDSELLDAGPGEFPVDVNPDDNPGSCEGRCGERSQSYDCQCDDVCQEYGDCCEDKEDVCGPVVEECEDHPKCHPGVTGESTHCSKYHKTVQECKDVDNDGCLELRQKKVCAEGKECVSTAEYEGGDTVAYCAPKKSKECKKSWKKRVCFSAGHSGKEVCVCVPKWSPHHD